jgi:hypothetical protein
VIIAVYSKFNIDRLLKLSRLILLVAASLLACFEVGVFFLYSSGDRFDMEEPKRPSCFEQPPFSYEAIGTGILQLNPCPAWGWVAHLAKELLVIAHNSRPDAVGKEVQILLGLKAQNETKEVVSGKTFFLEKDMSTGAFTFSDSLQPLWVKPILLDNGRILIEAGKKLGQLDSTHGHEEKGQFTIFASPKGMSTDRNDSTFLKGAFSQLRNAKYWGKDLLIEKYGGREFAGLQGKCKIDLKEGALSYVVFVGIGDYLMWKNGRWQQSPFSELTTKHPIALVKGVSPRSIELTVWDQRGFSPESIELAIEHCGRLAQKPEAVLTQPRFRTASQISCLLGKKRVMIRQGDWMLKTGSGWRNLRKKEEINNYLSHQMRGELFIFDALEKEQGRYVLKGTLFDEMRTQQQLISISIEMENKKGKHKKKRKIPFAYGGLIA